MLTGRETGWENSFLCTRRAWDGHPDSHAQPPPTTDLLDVSRKPCAAQAGCPVVSFCVLRTEIAKSPEYAIRLTPPWRNSAQVTRFHEKIFVKTRELSQ